MSDKDRMAELHSRIEALKAATSDEKPHVEEHYSSAQLGWRMVTEMVAGLGIGFGMGYGLDRLFGTLPIFLVLFTLLGLAAGVKVMLSTAQEFQKTNVGGGDPGKAEGPENGG